jgi:hypothetical protein
MDNARVPRDAYYLIDVTLRTDFKFKIASRGYNLKSWLDFQKTMDVKKVTYNEVTLEEYNKLMFAAQQSDIRYRGLDDGRYSMRSENVFRPQPKKEFDAVDYLKNLMKKPR